MKRYSGFGFRTLWNGKKKLISLGPTSWNMRVEEKPKEGSLAAVNCMIPGHRSESHEVSVVLTKALAPSIKRTNEYIILKAEILVFWLKNYDP